MTHAAQRQQPGGAVDVSFRDLTFTVQPRGGGAPLDILKGVSGDVRSGRCLAIMGASGAGKVGPVGALPHGQSCADAVAAEELRGRIPRFAWLTRPSPSPAHSRPRQTTLLDVLAGHTYSGTVGGQVLVNGQPRRLKTFLRTRWARLQRQRSALLPACCPCRGPCLLPCIPPPRLSRASSSVPPPRRAAPTCSSATC